MKNKIIFLLLICISSINSQQKFHINLNDRADDLFKVTLYPDELSEENNIYHFAATAPGMYQIIDAGRFVRSFKAFNETGTEIKTEQKSTNQWSLSDPQKIYKIEYTIAESWDTPVTENFIYRMGGTSMEADHVVINGPLVFGYFEGKQADPIYVKLDYPSDWEVGTALTKNDKNYYEAESYDHIVDSPFMLGELSTASVIIDDSEIDIYTYSVTGVVKSDNILESARDIFHALDEFVDGIPVERYVLLFHFEDQSVGAWEHSYSSFYVYQETPLVGEVETSIRDVIAHEIFHVITPLNIHSEIIEQFNFVNPVLSKHLWFYEGVTEWASHIMQLRSQLVPLDQHLNTLRLKLLIDDGLDKSISLVDLALKSFELQTQFQIVYQRGSVAMELLDLKILELSKGKRGLREVINELSEDYGPDESFDEENFFNEFVDRTYPEIKEFLNNFIAGTKPLPVKEYFDYIGINYYESQGYDSSKVSLGMGFGMEGERIVITKVPENSNAKPGDIMLKVNGEELTLATAQQIFTQLSQMKVSDKIIFNVERDGSETEYELQLKPLELRHIFETNPSATPEQLALREAWMKNL
ncbi:MAG: hypothetical protein R6W90_09180 [Ignavibacteriaceae bacterium]